MPSNPIRWLNRDAVLAAHEVSLSRFGGSPGIRDEHLLDSALARPEMIAHYEPTATVYRLAAAYAFGLAKNHAFVDGNKRIGFLAAYMFLRDNGYRLIATEQEVVELMLAVASSAMGEDQVAEFFASRTVEASLDTQRPQQ